jgi:hypothetical protein
MHSTSERNRLTKVVVQSLCKRTGRGGFIPRPCVEAGDGQATRSWKGEPDGA